MAAKPKPLPFSKGDRLWCVEHQNVFEVTSVEVAGTAADAILSCGCVRESYLPSQGVSLEDLSSDAGRKWFPADLKTDLEESVYARYRATTAGANK